ncbi:MAG: 4-(cytidine 5'-diphospho)-2-C-methyl-D-erythritol kinase [Chitinophagaceae bacterium]
MVVFPNAKINLGLRVTSKRQDGYHNLDTVFYPLPYHDILEAVQVKESSNEISFVSTGKKIEGSQENNLCIKAYKLLKNDFPSIPKIQVHLHKLIPMGAGLGGGSSDGAFMLRLLNTKFNLGLDETKMIEYALMLGSDCPIFIKNKPCYATGRGELLEEIGINLSDYYFLLVSPCLHISTADAFKGIQPNSSITTCKEITSLPIEQWRDSLINDFEASVFQIHPDLNAIKEKLYQLGAVYASMTGTGSTFFGIFKQKPVFEKIFDQNVEIKLIDAVNK